MFSCLNNRNDNGMIIKSKDGKDLFLNKKPTEIGRVFYSGTLNGLPSNTYYNQLWNKNLTIENNKRFKYCEHSIGYSSKGQFYLIDEDDNLFVAGAGYYGGLGYAANGIYSDTNYGFYNLGKFKKVSALPKLTEINYYRSSFFLTSNGRLYFSGRYGQSYYGNNNETLYSSVDNEFNGTVNIVDVCALNGGCFILDSEGYIYVKGYNGYGQLANNSTNNDYNFRKIGLYNVNGYTNPYINNNWKQIATGYNTIYALNNDGQLYGCGRNYDGQLALGNNSDYSTLQRIGGNLLFKKVKAGYYHMICQDIDGNIYTAGENVNGQLGTGDLTSRNQLVKIFSNINARDIFAGQRQSAILDNYGGLYMCGYSNGNIINGFYGSVKKFTKVGCYNNVKYVQMNNYLISVIAEV